MLSSSLIILNALTFIRKIFKGGTLPLGVEDANGLSLVVVDLIQKLRVDALLKGLMFSLVASLEPSGRAPPLESVRHVAFEPLMPSPLACTRVFLA